MNDNKLLRTSCNICFCSFFLAPYGIREGAKRIGTEKDECALIEE